MDTQTDNAAAGTQVHSLVKHHQQHGSNSGNKSGSSSNNSNTISNTSSKPALGSNNDNHSKESSQAAASSSTIAQIGNASSTSSACIPAGAPLLLHQFTHHPPQHLLQHSRSVIDQDDELSTPSTDLHISPSSCQESSSSSDKVVTISNHKEEVKSLHRKYSTHTTHSSVDTESQPRDYSERGSRSEGAASSSSSSSLSYPLYFTASESSHSPASLISGSISERRPSQIVCTDSSSSRSSDALDTICDARNPRSSAASFVDMNTCGDDSQNKPEGTTLPSSHSISLNSESFRSAVLLDLIPGTDFTALFAAPPSPLMPTMSSISGQYSSTIENDAIYSNQKLTSVDHEIVQEKICNAANGIIRLPLPHGNDALIQTSTPLSPAFSSYYISSTSEALKQHEQAEKRDEQVLPILQSFALAGTQQGPPFVSPNVLLHRRLIGKLQKSPLKQNGLSQNKLVLDQSFVGSSKTLPNLQEQRRSSLGNEASTTPQKNLKRDGAQSIATPSSFQLQPVPASKRRRFVGNSPNKISVPVAVSPLIEKRRKRSSEALHFGSPQQQQQRKVTLTSTTVKPTVKVFDSRFSGAEKVTSNAGKSAAAAAVPQFIASINTPTQPRTRVKRPRLNRTQSLPNLKAKPVLDMNLPASHRLALPPRLAEYLASLRESAQRQHHHIQQISLDSTLSTPSLTRDRGIGSAMAAHASSFARNGYCSTMIDSLGNVKSTYFPSLHPPITRQTLKELDLHEILKNPQLRHDIVFDSNVQFRPNFDGERGRKKKEFGNKYWYAIQREIETGCTCTSFSGKLLLPCVCGSENAKTAIGRFASSLSSVKSPMPSLANYSHCGFAFNGLSASRSDHPAAQPSTPAPGSAKIKSPNSAVGLGNGRIPSRIPLLIQELRSICLSVLPCPPNENEKMETPNSAEFNSSSITTISKNRSPQRQTVPVTASPYSNRTIAATPSTATSSVATHHILIAQALDSHLITQQIRHGILDIASLMSFLGSILKLHCAPMRDEVIEKMIKTICIDGEVAIGLRMCFEILELMKLDIANHQLRSSRLYLIETAVDFEIRWFREQLDQRRLTLERTRQWFTISFEEQRTLEINANLNCTRLISKSFDEGLMQLILEPPLTTPGTISPAAGAPLISSTSSLKHAYSNRYPETFQFDAYRLMSFHGDVTDITIVYMLLLLFRQLACSSTNLSQEALPSTTWSTSAIAENASTIATRQLASVKGEIWTLLNDADQETSLAGTCQSNAAPRTPTTPGLAGRILSYSALTGSHKLENPTWRKSMSDVLLQIAARAIDVQIQARKESRQQRGSVLPSPNPPSPPPPPPREETMKMLMSWMETNLRRGSPLHRLCQQRLKNVLTAHLEESQPKDRVVKTSRKEREEVDEAAEGSPKKRLRLPDGSVALYREGSFERIGKLDDLDSNIPSQSNVELAIQKGGLEPFTAEIKLLSDRIIKVKTFHLRVFRNLYEKIASEIQQNL